MITMALEIFSPEAATWPPPFATPDITLSSRCAVQCTVEQVDVLFDS